MCQDVTQQVTGSSLSGNMLNFQASVSGNGQRFSASQMRLWHSPCQRTPLGCNLVSHVSACWLTGLGLSTPSRYLARLLAGTPVHYYYYYYDYVSSPGCTEKTSVVLPVACNLLCSSAVSMNSLTLEFAYIS